VYELTTQRSSTTRRENMYLDDQAENFIDFKQEHDWTFGMVGHEVKRQNEERPT
jgi:hypothetical protein